MHSSDQIEYFLINCIVGLSWAKVRLQILGVNLNLSLALQVELRGRKVFSKNNNLCGGISLDASDW